MHAIVIVCIVSIHMFSIHMYMRKSVEVITSYVRLLLYVFVPEQVTISIYPCSGCHVSVYSGWCAGVRIRMCL